MSLKYIIYKGNKYVRVDSKQTYTDYIDPHFRDAGDEAEKFLKENLGKVLNPQALGIHTEIEPGSTAHVHIITYSDWKNPWGKFSLQTPYFKETDPKTKEVRKQMIANKGKVASAVHGLCFKGLIRDKNLSIAVEAGRNNTWCYAMKLTASVG